MGVKVSQEIAEKSTLKIELSPRGLFYEIIYGGEVLASAQYYSSSLNRDELLEKLGRDEELKLRFKSTVVMLDTNRVVLIPSTEPDIEPLRALEACGIMADQEQVAVKTESVGGVYALGWVDRYILGLGRGGGAEFFSGMVDNDGCCEPEGGSDCADKSGKGIISESGSEAVGVSLLNRGEAAILFTTPLLEIVGGQYGKPTIRLRFTQSYVYVALFIGGALQRYEVLSIKTPEDVVFYVNSIKESFSEVKGFRVLVSGHDAKANRRSLSKYLSSCKVEK